MLYDTGGYGMARLQHTGKGDRGDGLAAGGGQHHDPNLIAAAATRALKREIGSTAAAAARARASCASIPVRNPVSLAARIVDANAKTMTDPGARHAGKAIKRDGGKKVRSTAAPTNPRCNSDSSRKTYVQYLASYRGRSERDHDPAVRPGRCCVRRPVAPTPRPTAGSSKLMFLEPVMGEGDPGRSVPPAFYQLARESDPRARQLLFLVDSIQAGLPRRRSCCPIVDYPGFEGLEAPDMETYSRRSTPRSTRCRCSP